MRDARTPSFPAAGVVGLCGALAMAARALGPLPPAEALAAFETEPGFVVELAVAEPLVVDPVALAFDHRGRLFVAENRDYPVGAPDGRPLGVIALLEDTDGDGRMDRRTEFATGIAFPNGVLPWRDGVLVAAAPDVLWLRDTTGDGRADTRETLLSGFARGGSSQLRVNTPRLGPDGWIWLAGGLSGGEVFFPGRPEQLVDLARHDLRFRPDFRELAPVEGKGQYGLSFDDAGNRFTCMNRIHVQHAPLPLRYRGRNPHLADPGALANCPELIENTLLIRQGNAGARLFPISANVTTADSHAGTYSAACAVHVHRGDALPAEYAGAVFSCDPTANLVRGDRLVKRGGSFAAQRIRDGTEALRSRDDWFRPVFLADGPDGALYVADMYRGVIEHPEYLPEEVRKRLDFRAGDDRGRIWRLRGSGEAPAPSRKPPEAHESAGTLAEGLNSPTPWRRDAAFRLLVERLSAAETNAPADPALVAALENFAPRHPAAAVLRLNLLDLAGALDDAALEAALHDAAPAVRQNALRLAEPRLAANAKLAAAAFRAAEDADPHVRHQAALSLPFSGQPVAARALARIAAQAGDDPWTRAAALCGVTNAASAGMLFRAALRDPSPDAAAHAALLEQAALARTAFAPAEERGALLADLLRLAAETAFEARAAVFQGWRGGGGNVEGVRDLEAVVRLVTEAARLALVPETPAAARERAVALVAAAGAPAQVEALTTLLDPGTPAALQQAVVRALVQPAHVALAPALLREARWRAHAPPVRATLVGALLNRREFWPALLDALEAGRLPLGALNAAQRERLRAAGDAAVRDRARALFAAADSDGESAMARARAALELKPAPARGREVFLAHCAACHRFHREGVAVGPDLFDIRNQPKEAILRHIVLPDLEVAPNFTAYDCETTDGRSLTGLLVADMPARVTLRMAQGLEETVPRAQIASLAASPRSLMPAGFEEAISAQEMADLLAYLRGER